MIFIARAQPTPPHPCQRQHSRPPPCARLWARQAAKAKQLRDNAQRVLAQEGELGSLHALHQAFRETLIHDLDFERPEETPDWERRWEVGRKLAMTGWCVRMDTLTRCYSS